jgi:hypothetical protein
MELALSLTRFLSDTALVAYGYGNDGIVLHHSLLPSVPEMF